MARAIIARRQGDEYQSRIFWLHLLDLRISDFVKSVCLESDRISFVDDITVSYSEPICEESTGNRIDCDYYQCKYHVTQRGAFTYGNLLNPSFINCKESMLKRLYIAYKHLSDGKKRFRLYIVSNWFWHPDDKLSHYLSEERIRSTFYEGGPNSKTGTIQKAFVRHLSITEKELHRFLDTVRFQLGKNLVDLKNELIPRLKLANFKPVNISTTSLIYDDLTWKLFAQGRNYFNRKSFDEMMHEEKLVIPSPARYSEISICSYLQQTRRPRDIQSAHLDVSTLFKGRFPRYRSVWSDEVPLRIDSFLNSTNVKNLPQPIHLFFDCHLSIAFFVGHLLDPKYGIRVIPAQKTRTSGYEFWREPVVSKKKLWQFKKQGKIDKEVIIGISVTNPIANHLINYVKTAKLKKLPIILFQPTHGVGPKAIIDGIHAWQLGFNLQTLLRNIIPSSCQKIHFFYSGPVALAYILGNTLRFIANSVQLYEHDFEGTLRKDRYYPSIKLPMKSNKKGG